MIFERKKLQNVSLTYLFFWSKILIDEYRSRNGEIISNFLFYSQSSRVNVVGIG